MESNETHVAIGGLNFLEFLVNLQQQQILKKVGERIYGIILRGLSFPHTDNFITKSIDILKMLCYSEILPNQCLDFLQLYMIHTFNIIDEKCAYYEALMDYSKLLLSKTASKIRFFQIWKSKTTQDYSYSLQKLEHFIKLIGSEDVEKFLKAIN